MNPNPQSPFSRLSVRDPETNFVVQALYDAIEQTRAGAATNSTAAVQAQTTAAQALTLASSGGGGGGTSSGVVTIPTFSTLPSPNPMVYPGAVDGALISFSPLSADSGVLFKYSSTNLSWGYYSGNLTRTQANLSALASALGPSHTGLLVFVSDYWHFLQWIGSGWYWAPGDEQSGKYAYWPTAPGASTGWVHADGSTVNCLKSNGTIIPVTLVDTATNPLFLNSGAFTGSIVSASTPTFAGTPFSSVINHTHSVTITDPGHAHTVAESSGVGATSQLMPIAAQAAGTLATSTATTGISASTANPSGGVASITPTGSISLSGGPPVRNLAAPIYYRI